MFGIMQSRKYTDFDFFLQQLKKKGFDLLIYDERRIKKAFGKGLYGRLSNSLEQVGFRRIVLLFDEKESRISWPSDTYPDRIVVNVVRSVGTAEFIQAVKSAADELRELESVESDLKTK